MKGSNNRACHLKEMPQPTGTAEAPHVREALQPDVTVNSPNSIYVRSIPWHDYIKGEVAGVFLFSS
jgi:hypothetical protein